MDTIATNAAKGDGEKRTLSEMPSIIYVAPRGGEIFLSALASLTTAHSLLSMIISTIEAKQQKVLQSTESVLTKDTLKAISK